MARRHDLGRRGEDLVAAYLSRRGVQIQARNLRVGRDELDLVGRRGETWIVCEVRTRWGVDFRTILESVTPAKVERLRRAALAWLVEEGHRGRVRLDVAAVRFDRRGATLRYVENAL